MIPVLIIDDDQSDRYLLSRQLRETGLDIKIVERNEGQSALDYLAAYEANRRADPDGFPPAMIFVDINMPFVDGWKFLEGFAVLRESLPLDSSVVMMFSSSERPEDRNKSAEYPFVAGYLVKGDFTSEQLRDTIQAAL